MTTYRLGFSVDGVPVTIDQHISTKSIKAFSFIDQYGTCYVARGSISKAVLCPNLHIYTPQNFTIIDQEVRKKIERSLVSLDNRPISNDDLVTINYQDGNKTVTVHCWRTKDDAKYQTTLNLYGGRELVLS